MTDQPHPVRVREASHRGPLPEVPAEMYAPDATPLPAPELVGIDHAAWTALAHTRPGMCTYPVMLRQATPPAVQPAQRPATPTADTDLPAVTRYRWWRPWTRR